MPYKNLCDLPERVKNVLPKHAQEIYMATFNKVWIEFQKPEKISDDTSIEEISHKVAWASVKRLYKKNDGKWIKK